MATDDSGLGIRLYFSPENYNEGKNFLKTLMSHHQKKDYEKILVFCIGTNAMPVDSYGPFVGTFLKEQLKDYKDKIEIWGTLENHICATNIVEYAEKAKKGKYFIIAVDASLNPDKSYTNKISITKGKLNPGKAANKNLPSIGDISISGCSYDIGCFPSNMYGDMGQTIKMAAYTSKIITEFVKEKYSCIHDNNVIIDKNINNN